PPAQPGRELRIDITRGRVEPLPIAISNFIGQQPNEQQVGREIAQVVSADLDRSGLFLPIDQRAFIEDPARMGAVPRFGDWRIINAQALVTGTSALQPDGRLRVEFRLWDTYAERQLAGFQYTTQPDSWRRVAHIV